MLTLCLKSILHKGYVSDDASSWLMNAGHLQDGMMAVVRGLGLLITAAVAHFPGHGSQRLYPVCRINHEWKQQKNRVVIDKMPPLQTRDSQLFGYIICPPWQMPAIVGLTGDCVLFSERASNSVLPGNRYGKVYSDRYST